MCYDTVVSVVIQTVNVPFFLADTFLRSKHVCVITDVF